MEGIIEELNKEIMNEEKAIIDQKNYCIDNRKPHFAPEDGICFHCHKSIYRTYGGSKGISADYACKHLITGCPHCCYSFCE
jgi:hypothetical protein